MTERRLERWLRPRVVLPALAVLLLVAILFSPGGSDQSTRLTTYATGPYAARGVYDVLATLGWHVGRRRSAFGQGLDTAATYVILEPALVPSATEVSALLDAVKHGARLLVIPDGDTPLTDSLGITPSSFPEAGMVIVPLAVADGAPAPTPLEAAAGRARAIRHYLVPVPASDSDTTATFPPDTTTLVRVRTKADSMQPAVLERHLGMGDVLVLGDGNFLRNGTLRDTVAAVFAVRLIEHLSPEPSRPLIFDEYHQGYSDAPGAGDVIGRALVWTTTGRVASQLLIAGLVLLIAVGVRPIAPAVRRVIERRSPFEHVEALSLAYEQVHATRLATRRLVHGLRRRHPLGSATADESQYLSLLAARAPAAAADVQLLRRALDEPLPAGEWVALGGAIDHIERTLNP